ncbi:hypothetical protein D9M71_362940 [compost metagenome]
MTGKANYKAFSSWLEQDVVGDPECVAQQFAPQSAVYFWDSHRLNRLADTDDIQAITKAINGGLNGFPERRQLLERAKAALHDLADEQGSPEVIESPNFNPTHQVVPLELNLRSAPQVAAATWRATLYQGSKVEIVNTLADGWVQVRTLISHTLREGFVAQRYLAPLPVSRGGFDPVEQDPPEQPIPPVHLQRNLKTITRASEDGRAYPLGESRRPQRKAGKPEARAAQLLKIIDYLDCASLAHRRYKAGPGSTCCDVYACDYCDLAGVYLPRVWWTGRALQRMAHGASVMVAYGQSVRELNANALYDWLEDYGSLFGWYRELDLTTLQAAANAGEVCLAVARHKDLNLAGHIAMVVPEQPERQARRDATGSVTRPVESYASANRRKFAVSRSAWWQEDLYRAFAFWRHP